MKNGDKLLKTLYKIGINWPHLLGKDVYNTYEEILGDNFTSDRKIEILLSIYEPSEIIKDDSKRSLILQTLNEKDAEELSIILSGNTLNPYDKFESLTRKDVRKVAEFFNIDLKKNQLPSEDSYELTCKANAPLRNYQRQVVRDAIELLSGNSRCLIHMPTGSGKTTTAMEIICHHMYWTENPYVIWMAYSQELCRQADNAFRRIWKSRGDREVNIYDIFGNSNETGLPETNKPALIICTMGKLVSMCKKTPSILHKTSKNVTLVVFDEAHQSIASEYRYFVEQLTMRKDSKLIGLTATPGRSYYDEEQNRELAEFYYKNKIQIKTNGETASEMLTREGYLSKIKWKELHYESDFSFTPSEINQIQQIRKQGNNIPKEILEKMSLSVRRNVAICDCVNQYINNDNLKRLLIFANSIEHSKTISALLKACGYNSYHVDGSTPNDKRKRILEEFKNTDNSPKILCNYNLYSTGVDIPNIDCGIIARPMSSIVLFSQMIGRMIRGPRTENGTENVSIAVVVDSQLPQYEDEYNVWIREWDQ